ncbi:hypothetical protein MUK42_25174 [Musa troglodytarum]|uniref:Uncharacterized protein n=1 Tax=Musa troglodytarum TaxID=320322 RepID=A0A9E7LB16_9LILI|nr:hypothetical protein MUK42_25174 [Musa troglodytarum]
MEETTTTCCLTSHAREQSPTAINPRATRPHPSSKTQQLPTLQEAQHTSSSEEDQTMACGKALALMLICLVVVFTASSSAAATATADDGSCYCKCVKRCKTVPGTGHFDCGKACEAGCAAGGHEAHDASCDPTQ